MKTSEQEHREQVCVALKAVTGFLWQPYLRDDDKGPEQDISFYELPLLGSGRFVPYGESFKRIIKEAMRFDMRNSILGPWTGLMRGRIVQSIVIPASSAEDDNNLLAIQESAQLQAGLKTIRDISVYANLVEADKLFRSPDRKPDHLAPIARLIKSAVGLGL